MPTGEHEPLPDHQPDNLYLQAARFPSERKAGRAYFRAQEAIFATACNLSVTRFLLERVAHVAVIGEPPTMELDGRLRRILSTGSPVTLSDEVLRTLWQRRLEANRAGPWVERHFRPGTSL